MADVRPDEFFCDRERNLGSRAGSPKGARLPIFYSSISMLFLPARCGRGGTGHQATSRRTAALRTIGWDSYWHEDGRPPSTHPRRRPPCGLCVDKSVVGARPTARPFSGRVFRAAEIIAGSGSARRAATALFRRFSGKWEVPVAWYNHPALLFRRATVRAVADGPVEEMRRRWPALGRKRCCVSTSVLGERRRVWRCFARWAAPHPDPLPARGAREKTEFRRRCGRGARCGRFAGRAERRCARRGGSSLARR